MEIRINGKTADIIIEQEETLGQIIAGLDTLLSESNHWFTGFSVDGEKADSSSMEEAFSKKISSVKILDVYTQPLADFFAICLFDLLGDIKEYEDSGSAEKNNFYEDWKERASSLFAQEQMPDLFSLYENTFKGRGVNLEDLRGITEERLREVKEPAVEIKRIKPAIDEICESLVNLPLDIQTGKDKRAAETIQFFTAVAEKIFRIFRQLDFQGYVTHGETPVTRLIGEFGAAVKELLDAYERHDTVLVGDLAEYEVAPRMKELYNSLNDEIEQNSGEAAEV